MDDRRGDLLRGSFVQFGHQLLRGMDVGAVGNPGPLRRGDKLVLCRVERGGSRREGAGIVVVRRGDLIAVQLVDLLDCGERGVPVRLRGRRCADACRSLNHMWRVGATCPASQVETSGNFDASGLTDRSRPRGRAASRACL